MFNFEANENNFDCCQHVHLLSDSKRLTISSFHIPETVVAVIYSSANHEMNYSLSSMSDPMQMSMQREFSKLVMLEIWSRENMLVLGCVLVSKTRVIPKGVAKGRHKEKLKVNSKDILGSIQSHYPRQGFSDTGKAAIITQYNFFELRMATPAMRLLVIKLVFSLVTP
jgi:hypothetical protein